MPTTSTSALAKLTPEERKKVINLAARVTLNKHLRGILDEREAEVKATEPADQTSTLSNNPNQG